MRALDLGRSFSMIFIPFNSLQNTYTLDDVERTFAASGGTSHRTAAS